VLFAYSRPAGDNHTTPKVPTGCSRQCGADRNNLRLVRDLLNKSFPHFLSPALAPTAEVGEVKLDFNFLFIKSQIQKTGKCRSANCFKFHGKMERFSTRQKEPTIRPRVPTGWSVPDCTLHDPPERSRGYIAIQRKADAGTSRVCVVKMSTQASQNQLLANGWINKSVTLFFIYLFWVTTTCDTRQNRR